MKKLKYFALCFVASIVGMGFQSCENDMNFESYVYPAANTKTELGTLIDSCNEIIEVAEVGTHGGQYLSYVLENFQIAVREAQKVLSNNKATQAMVDLALKKLGENKSVFLVSVNVDDLDPNDANLVLHLRFNGNSLDGSAIGNVLTLNAGNALSGNGLTPSFTKDRFGRDNMAMHFEKGGFISIPYVEGKSEALNPEVMTFMCWIKESNPPAPVQRWIFCLDTWNIFYIVIPAGGTEFQFGGQTTRGWIDPIMNSGINASSNWSHLVVTYSPEGVAFYKNGELVKEYAGRGNFVKNGANKPFLIGIMDPARELYYEGDMDEFRLYNKALNANEVMAVFNIEKPGNMVVDKTALHDSIGAANAIKAAVVEGYYKDQYLSKTVTNFSNSIDSALVTYSDNNASQNKVDKALVNLSVAIEWFRNAANVRDFDPNISLLLNFDGNTNDFSYNNQIINLVNGTSNLPPYPTIDRYGNYDGAYHFDNGSYISVPYENSLNSSELTYMFWIKAANPAGVANPYLLSINRRFGFYIGLKVNEIVYGGVGSNGSINEISSGINVSSIWKHITLTYSSANGIKLYEDGINKKTDAAQGLLVKITNNSPFVIGVKGISDNKTSYFKGDLDEVRVYTKSLNDSEILEIYNQQKP